MSKRFADSIADSVLYVVSTPIGNLGDIGSRAVEILATADAIICEDTRRCGLLLERLGIRRDNRLLVAYHDHSGTGVRTKIMNLLRQGKSLALTSDAGTPLLSDPGYRLVASAIDAGVAIVPVPGPSALIAALSVSGLPTDRFSFLGFAPSRGRDEFVDSLASERGTIIFYESPHKLRDILQRLTARFPERRAVMARELTKLHEEILRGSLRELAETIESRSSVKGEITILLAPQTDKDNWSDTALTEALTALTDEPLRAAVDKVTAMSGESRRRIYQLALRLRDDS